jgi:membrane protease YdiL (CAAX protease family)
MDAPMIARFLNSHPVASFALLTFAIAYGIGLPVQFAFGAPFPLPGQRLAYYLGRMPVVFAPALAALVVVSVQGPADRRRWLSRLKPRWHLLAWIPALLALSIAVASAAFLMAGGPLAVLREFWLGYWQELLLLFLCEFLVVGLGEELGWRGWLLPHLLDRGRTQLAASLYVGALWGAWHLPILLSGLSVAVPFLATVLALSLLFTGLWLRTASVLVVATAHAAFNTPYFYAATIEGWVTWSNVAMIVVPLSLAVTLAFASASKKN